MTEAVIDPRFQDRERQPGLDLLRALAIIVVVIYHAALFGFKLPGRVDRFGWIGVDLFFVLSGYLIGSQLLAPLARDQRMNLGRFFARRALRIMPAYFVVLAIYFLLPSSREYSEMSQPLWKFLLSIQNIALHGGTAFSHAWALALIAYGLWLGEGDYLTVTACTWQFPLIALGMAALLICAISPRLVFRRVAIPGAAFIASIAYSAYLIQKLVIRFVEQFCASHNIVLTSAPALICVELCVYAAATILFFTVERPFLQLRHRITPRSRPPLYKLKRQVESGMERTGKRHRR